VIFRTRLVAALAGLLACCARPAGQLPAPGTTGSGAFELVWADEFDREGRPDPTKWSYEHGFVRNEELQWYRPENARVEHGELVIEARRERVANPEFDSTSSDFRYNRRYAEYTSASLLTKGLASWQYGRFEMRARIDVRPGMWPAFWTLGEQGFWPASGEIDVMEYYRGVLLANVAWSDSNWTVKWDTERRPIAQLGDATWADNYHVWRMDWDEREIRLSVDDLLLNRTSLDSTFNRSDGPANPLRQPHYLLLSLAIGGWNGGDPSRTQFPARFAVDYVRVYRRTRPR
jgi:beta-glucanase (GH16 family)